MRINSNTLLRTAAAALLAATALAACSFTRPEASLPERADQSAIQFYLERAPGPASSQVLLVILQGSDCNSVKHDTFIKDVLRNVWPTADLLLVEKYGIDSSLAYSANPERADCPPSYMERDNPTQRVKDLTTVLHHVKTRNHYNNIIVMGGSEGAAIANMLTASTGLPSATVVINGGGRWFVEDVLHNMRSEVPTSELQETVAGFKGFADRVVTDAPFSLQVSNHGFSWWHEMLTMDQQAILSSTESPVLIVQGGRDSAVSPAAVSHMMGELRKAGKDNIDYLNYPDLNHALARPDGKSGAENVVADVHQWLKAKLENEPYTTAQSEHQAHTNSEAGQ